MRPVSWISCCAVKFQSAPGPRAGRCAPGGVGRVVRISVSIRARPEGRAVRCARQCPARSSRFQSAPGPRAGRCLMLAAVWLDRPGFNPRPARGPGGAILAARKAAGLSVSIRARPEGRAVLMHPDGRVKLPHVSIRARPEGRAVRYTDEDIERLVREFQSAPGPRAGRCARPSRSRTSASRFNPRPARGPGGAPVLRRVAEVLVVSIRARPEGRAVRARPDEKREAKQVSIRARPEGRAVPDVFAG